MGEPLDFVDAAPPVHQFSAHSQETRQVGFDIHPTILRWSTCTCGWFSTPTPFSDAAQIAEGLHWEQAQLEEVERHG